MPAPDPDGAQARWTAAMRAGDFAAAWAVSDAVLAARDPLTRDDPRSPYHLRWVWDGRPPDGRRVLVRCYHGLGDTIQMARFLPALRARAASLTVEAQPELLPLLRSLSGPDRLLGFRPDAPLPPAELDVEIMELPHLLRVTTATLPAAPYLAVAEDRVAAARARVGAGALERRPTNRDHPSGKDARRDEVAGARSDPLRPDRALALCWRAGGWDPERSVPLDRLAAACAGWRLVSAQRGPAAAEGAAAGVVNPDDRSTNVLDTAALIRAAGLVATVDTMVAHLAGALGCPTHLLLRADADWRWMAGRSDSPWYPSLRLHRQDAAGDWRAPLAGLRRALDARAASRAGW